MTDEMLSILNPVLYVNDALSRVLEVGSGAAGTVEALLLQVGDS